MKAGLHPELKKTKVHCNGCGIEFTTEATVETITVDICSNCHPFYTGKQKLVDTAGRVEKFKARTEAAKKSKAALDKRNAGKAAKAEADETIDEKNPDGAVAAEIAAESDADAVANEAAETQEIAEELEAETVDTPSDDAKPEA